MLNPLVEPGALTDLDKFMFESWGYLVIPDVRTKMKLLSLEASKQVHQAARTKIFGQL